MSEHAFGQSDRQNLAAGGAFGQADVGAAGAKPSPEAAGPSLHR